MINVRRNWDKLQNEEIEKKNCGKDLDRTEQRIVTLKKGRSGDKKDGRYTCGADSELLIGQLFKR